MFQAQLLKKTSLLIDCFRDCGHHGDVMATLVSTAQVLPPLLLCEDSVCGEDGEVMMDMWVRGKRELASHLDSGNLQQWKDRCVCVCVLVFRDSVLCPSSPQDTDVTAPSFTPSPLHQAQSSHPQCRVYPPYQPRINQSDCSRL